MRLTPVLSILMLVTAACAAAPIDTSPQGTRTYGDASTAGAGGLLQPGNKTEARDFNPPITPTPALTPTPTPTPTPSPLATATPTPAPLASGQTPLPTAAPSTTPTPATFGLAALSCRLYDEAGVPMDKGYVHVTSLDANVPFDQTSNVSAAGLGLYNIGRVPAGSQLSVTAGGLLLANGKNLWTQRTQIVTVPANTPELDVNFGSPAAQVNSNSGYFISRYPEVSSVEYINAPNTGEIRLKFNEPFDSANQTLIANAVRVYPANNAADPSYALGPIGDLNLDPTTTAKYTYHIDNQSVDANNVKQVTTTWNADGDILTFTFPLSFLQSLNPIANYQITLFSLGATQVLDQDAPPHALGQSYNGSTALTFGGYGASELMFNGFKGSEPLALDATDGTPELRWGATHKNSALFSIQDGTTLTGH